MIRMGALISPSANSTNTVIEKQHGHMQLKTNLKVQETEKEANPMFSFYVRCVKYCCILLIRMNKNNSTKANKD